MSARFVLPATPSTVEREVVATYGGKAHLRRVGSPRTNCNRRIDAATALTAKAVAERYLSEFCTLCGTEKRWALVQNIAKTDEVQP